MSEFKGKDGLEDHCMSCHEDQNDWGFPYDESYEYGKDGKVIAACCCCTQHKIWKENNTVIAATEGGK